MSNKYFLKSGSATLGIKVDWFSFTIEMFLLSLGHICLGRDQENGMGPYKKIIRDNELQVSGIVDYQYMMLQDAVHDVGLVHDDVDAV